MEATVITLHGRQVCKLVDVEKVKKIKDELSPHWNRELIEIGKKHFTPIEILK
jgi:hypothetical protein